MAKQPTLKGGTSRIRFIMLEAEIPEGDLSQISSAIQNALKQTAPIIQQRLHAQTPAVLPNGMQDADMETQGEVMDAREEDSEEAAVARPAREAHSRKPTKPKVLDFDHTSGVSFETFANEHIPKSDVDRSLVVLAWFKAHRPDDAVTVNHVYTCYRVMSWPSGSDDFSSPLRSLKKKQLVTNPGRGQYSINHLGIARVEKMRATS